MSRLLSDFVNDRVQTVRKGGTVHGVYDTNLVEESSSESEDDYDPEQQLYVQKELETYATSFNKNSNSQQSGGGLTDLVDDGETSYVESELSEAVMVPRVFSAYKFDTYYKKDLPIDSYKDKILHLLTLNNVVIIHGDTGCGKTTQVPQFILDQCKARNAPCNIVVTQPRRIAAISIAQRVCEERGWALGTVCGYQVGLDKNAGDDVVLTYVTTEVLLQKLIVQKNLNKFTHLIIDEVHERNKSLDFLLLLVRKYLFTNSPNVKIVLMSATMNTQQFAHYFRSISRGDPQGYIPPPVCHVDKKSEYTTEFFYYDSLSMMIPTPVTFALDEPFIGKEQYELCMKLINYFGVIESETMTNEHAGSVLVFLPGFHEIEEMFKLLSNSETNLEVIPLHSSLTSEHMGKAFQKPKEGVRKIILSTNIAESSVTVPDVTYVVDFCLTKVMAVNTLTKFSTLTLEWASHNNCKQRAGRVGRVSNGKVYRLVPEAFYKERMARNSVPELQRAPLENIILYMKLLNLNDTPKNVLSLAIDPPNLKDVESCIWHLKEAGALSQTCNNSQDGDITFLGKVMGNLPLDIHLSKMILLGHMFCCLEEAVIMAAGCTTRNLFVNAFYERLQSYKKKLVWSDGSSSDFITLLMLHNVWFNMRREGRFQSHAQEYAWCRTNFVNLKGLREWDILIGDIYTRLKKFNIEKPVGGVRVTLRDTEKAIFLKVIICGAFYPNYFVRSCDYGQVNENEALKVVDGRDFYRSVYFTNMKLNHPGKIYIRQIKKLLNADNNVQIGFDQSSKVYVEFKGTKQPEPVNVDGQTVITTLPGRIPMDVYVAVRKRQLRKSFQIKILPEKQAWEFANATEEKMKVEQVTRELNCFSSIDYCPLPTLDIEYITIRITHVEDVDHFYCHNWNDETVGLLQQIYVALNGPGVLLKPTEEKLVVNVKFYAAMYNSDGKYYRCKILHLIPVDHHPKALIMFIDYGNTQAVYVNKLFELPDAPECYVSPVAMCCVLSGIQPSSVLNKKAQWDKQITTTFKQKTDGVLLHAKVYSVVNNVVHLELYTPKGITKQSYNEWLIQEGHAQKCEESQLSKIDHEKRVKVLASENPNQEATRFSHVKDDKSYEDFEAPALGENNEMIDLKGPFSPLEMKICGLMQATANVIVRIEDSSVNAVLLDDAPEDPHTRLIVAGSVNQSATTTSLKISQTTVMPSSPGLPMIMTLLFCPTMEPKLTADGSRVASLLCGLGTKTESDTKPVYPMHDISLVLDTELTQELFMMINQMRFMMNKAVRIMNNVYNEVLGPTELPPIQKTLKEYLLRLIYYKQKTVDRVNFPEAGIWGKHACEDVEILKVNVKPETDEIWPLLWFVKLDGDRQALMSLTKNVDELTQIAKMLIPEKPISCEVCGSDPLTSVSQVRIHLISQAHKAKYHQYFKH